MELNKEVKQVQQYIANQSSRYRDLLTIVTQNPPKDITIGNWDEKGDIKFSIAMVDLGLKYSDYQKFEDEFFSYFIIDFIGELIVRENLPLFVEKLKVYDVNNYTEYGDHKRFGVKAFKGKLIFEFHVSFLKKLLTENLRESLG
jgi:hypothetical protein